ncbi:MAG: membrane integrity-associated transporter subunit PqiC [Legionella sp.]|nr:membrane integrity-associated transporter subunit PqiC [Legionella sp.]
MKTKFAMLGAFLLIGGCSVKTPISTQYQLKSYCIKHGAGGPCHYTLMVSVPEAAGSYLTEQMWYVREPFQVQAFAHNAWVSPPAAMLYPLLIQSLQHSGFFHAVTSSGYSEGTDFRLDTQLYTLEQNFLKHPSEMEFSAKVVLTNIKDNHILGSHIITEHVPCPSDTPEGGVIAANQAVELFTAEVNEFVRTLIRHHL